MTEGGGTDVAVLLEQAIEEAGQSVRGLARDLAGPDATDRQIESERRTLNKYLAGTTTPGHARARLLAAKLGKPDGYFVTDRPRRQTDADVAELRREVARLREETADRFLENAEQQAETQRLLSEIRSLLEQRRSA